MRQACLAAFAVLALAAPAAATNYTLTVSSSGPSGQNVVTSSNPATGINCGSTNAVCSASFPAGSTVTLTEVNSSTVAFAGWSGAQGCATNLPACAVLVATNAAVTATFMPYLSVSLSGNGLGSVADSSGIVDCASTNGCVGGGAQIYAFPVGSTVTLAATPGSSTATFTGWTGAAGCTTASTCAVVMNGYEAVVATFTSSGPHLLAVEVPLGGGVVTSTNGISCPPTCEAETSSGTALTITTEALAGYDFAGWSNGGCSGTTTACVIVSSSDYQGLGGSQTPAAWFYLKP